MEYDIASKRLLEIGKESLLRWAVGIEVESADLLEELPKDTVSLRSSDFPLLVRDKEGLEQIVLLEFQTQWEIDLPLRLLEYYARFKMKYRTRVTPVVLLFRKHGGAKESYTDEVVSIRFRLIKMWEISGRELLDRGEVYLYPFVPLSESSEDEIYEASEKIYESPVERPQKGDLLTALAIFAGLRDENITMELIRRRRDIMIESFAYEIIKREGREEGLIKGLQRGMLENAREAVLEALNVRFHNVPERLSESVRKIEEHGKLKFLLRHAIICESLNNFEEILNRSTDF